jgi:molecular chaperone GrpE
MDEKDTKDSEPRSENGENAVPDSQENETAPLSELEGLRRSLEAKEAEAQKNYELYLRQAAELENLKKRTQREKEEAIRFGNETLVKDLLPVLDNLERAVEHAQGGGNGKPLLEGIELVLKGFLEVMEKHGVKQISAKGQPFDPQKHEAFAQVETEEHEPNTVVQELHKGYTMLDRLVRPSLVSVAKSPEKKEEVDGEGKVENGQGDD